MVRGVNDMWAEWTIAHPGFGRIVMLRWKWQQWGHAVLLLTHPASSSYLSP